MQQVEIRVKGRMDAQWSEWFSGLTIRHSALDETYLSGFVQDQSALYGVITQLGENGLQLISITCGETKVDHCE